MLWLFLLLPKPWSLDTVKPLKSIQIELLETNVKQAAKPKITQNPVIASHQPESTTKPESNVNSADEQAKTIVDRESKHATFKPQPPSNQPITKTPQSDKNSIPTISAIEIMRLAKERKSYAVTPEFQAKTKPTNEFMMPKPVSTDWYADLPYLDETVDKPKLLMNFYAPGIQGSADRFFDKAALMKTITTKHGTQTNCSWIINIVMCGWQ